jgi:hypothetical protein
MDSSGRHDDHIRVPCIHPDDILVEMVDRRRAQRDPAGSPLAWDRGRGGHFSHLQEAP